jgi:hypothetical protein
MNATTLRRTARLIGIFFMILAIVYWVKTLQYSQENADYFFLNASDIFKLIALIVTLAAAIICWWRDNLGGWLFIAAYVLWFFSPAFYYGLYLRERFEFDWTIAFYFLPCLIAGVCLFIAAHHARTGAD